MSASTIVQTILKADIGVIAVVSDRVYVGFIPTSATYPAVKITMMNEDRDRQLPEEFARIRVSCFDEDTDVKNGYTSAYAVKEAVRLALDRYQGVSGGVSVDGIAYVTTLEAPEPDSGRYGFHSHYDVDIEKV